VSDSLCWKLSHCQFGGARPRSVSPITGEFRATYRPSFEPYLKNSTFLNECRCCRSHSDSTVCSDRQAGEASSPNQSRVSNTRSILLKPTTISTHNTMAPPRGPRAGPTTGRRGAARGSSTRGGSSRGGARGGIQKRRGAPRTDIDGDLDMDGPGSTKKPAIIDPNAPRRPGRPTTAGPAKLSTKHAQVIARHLNGATSNTLASRTSTTSVRIRGPDSITWLKVKGLKTSKAATNPGGGVQELVQFLERKASTLANRRPNHPVAIKKVSPPNGRRGGSKAIADGPHSPLAIDYHAMLASDKPLHIGCLSLFSRPDTYHSRFNPADIFCRAESRETLS
jgi:hypothetical protein